MKRSDSLLFRDAAAKVKASELATWIKQNHKKDISFHNENRGALSFDDTSWAEWCMYDDGTADVWAYNPRDGKPYKTNPQIVK